LTFSENSTNRHTVQGVNKREINEHFLKGVSDPLFVKVVSSSHRLIVGEALLVRRTELWASHGKPYFRAEYCGNGFHAGASHKSLPYGILYCCNVCAVNEFYNKREPSSTSSVVESSLLSLQLCYSLSIPSNPSVSFRSNCLPERDADAAGRSDYRASSTNMQFS